MNASGPFLKRPGNFSRPKESFKIKICWIVPQFLAHETIKIASFTDSLLIVSLYYFQMLLKLWSWMQTQQTQNSFPGPNSYRDFRETVARSLCAQRVCSVAVHCFVLAAEALVSKWSPTGRNGVTMYKVTYRGYSLKVWAQHHFFRTYHSWPTGPIPAALSSWILHLTVLVRVSCPFTPSSRRNLFTKNSLMMGTEESCTRLTNKV